MRIAVLIDEERLEREHEMLSRLCIGLIDEGAHLTRLIPDTVNLHTGSERAVRIAERILYPSRVLPWMRRRVVQMMVESMERHLPELVFAVGLNAWPYAVTLAELLDVPAVFDVWKMPVRLQTTHSLAGRAYYVAATRPIAQYLKRKTSADAVATIAYGVACPPARKAKVPRGTDDSIGLAILGNSNNTKAYRSVFAALRSLTEAMPTWRAFVELEGSHEHEIWRIARRFDLSSRVSSITSAASHRLLLSQCDLAIVPEKLGRVRTVLLEMMAAGMPIVAHEDPAVDYLIEGETAQIVREPSEDAWRAAITQLLGMPDRAAALGQSARAYVAARHSPSRHAEGLWQVFNQILTGGAMPFSDAQPR